MHTYIYTYIHQSLDIYKAIIKTIRNTALFIQNIYKYSAHIFTKTENIHTHIKSVYTSSHMGVSGVGVTSCQLRGKQVRLKL